MTHTPTGVTARPWAREGKFISVNEGQIAQILGADIFDTEANIEFIVRAVNAHDELVLAAKDACIHIKELAETLNADYQNNSTFKRLMAAIAKAEGKS